MPFDIPQEHPALLISFGFVWITGWIIASVIYRQSRNKPILFPRDVGAEFVEAAVSGYSHDTWYTKLGGASRCLYVAVAHRHLIIRPHFPFNLMFLPEVYGLEHKVPLEQITKVEFRPGVRKRLEIAFRDNNGQSRRVSLYLRKPQELVSVLPRVSHEPIYA